MKVYNTEKVKQELLYKAHRVLWAIKYEIQKYEKENGVKPENIKLPKFYLQWWNDVISQKGMLT